MLYQEPLTATIAGRGDVLGHQPISEAEIIPEFLQSQLRAIKAMRYSTKPYPIRSGPMEAVSPLDSCLLLRFLYLGELDRPFTKSR